MNDSFSRRDLIRVTALLAAAMALPRNLRGAVLDNPEASAGADAARDDTDQTRLVDWVSMLRLDPAALAAMTMGARAARVGELAIGTPYEAGALEVYLKEGGDPTKTEPITLSLTRFDCVTLVESCLAIARVASAKAPPTWDRFAREVERMRYRNGKRRGYTSRLHYFSEWITDGARRGLVRDLAADLGGIEDARPLRFMSEHRGSYPALANDAAFREIMSMERRLDCCPRKYIPAARIPQVADRIQTGDILAFTTSIPGLDVSHAAFAYRDTGGILRVLHAPLSGGAVEITRATLPEYVGNIRRATGILVARPLL
ncbi:MAG TPA: N-acetylmuramoyl-L-alanine amidase-like domain-containing protein [Gemmatimonadaceae bacterium]|nr:N-acetylmuramoyl-L-alanine amidase-like domain-containing protein [Gemmatimonadaceae bacterium]